MIYKATPSLLFLGLGHSRIGAEGLEQAGYDDDYDYYYNYYYCYYYCYYYDCYYDYHYYYY